MKNIIKTLLILFGFTPTFAQENYSFNEVYPITDQGMITMLTNDADITIVGTDRSDVLIKVERQVIGKYWTNKPFELQVIPTEVGLAISDIANQDKELNYSISINGEVNYTIELEVPLNTRLTLNGEDDDYTISNINNEITIVNQDGDIHLNQCIGESITIKTDDGGLYMENCMTNLIYNTIDGDLNAKDSSFEILTVDVEDGNIDLQNTTLTTATLNTEDGNIKVSGNTTPDARLNIHSEDGYVSMQVAEFCGQVIINHEDSAFNYAEAKYLVKNQTDETKHIDTTCEGNGRILIKTEDGKVSLL